MLFATSNILIYIVILYFLTNDHHFPDVNYLPPHPTPIDSNNLPTNIRTCRTRQPNNHTLEILWTSPPSRGDPTQNTLCPFLILNQRLIHIRSNIPRRYRIHTNTLTRPLIRQRLSQLAHATLRRRIRRDRNAALERE